MESLADYEVGTLLINQQEAEREEWFRKRAGKFTCSRFGDLIGTGRSKDKQFTDTGMSYIYQVAAERLGSYNFEFDNNAVRWGKDHEAEAIATYLSHVGRDEIESGPTCFRQYNHFIAGTPDGIIAPDGTIECKCPYTSQEHLRTVYENKVPDRYEWQVVGHMLITGASWCDFISYDPRLSDGLFILRVERDETRIAFLLKRLEAAETMVQEVLAKVRAK